MRSSGTLYAPHIISTLRTMSAILLETGRPSEALYSTSCALKLAVLVPGPSAVQAFQCNLLLGRVYAYLGRHADSLCRYEASLLTERSLAGTYNSECLASVLYEMGQVHRNRGNFDGDIRCFEEVIRFARLLFGCDDLYVGRMLLVQCKVRLQKGVRRRP